MNRSGWLLFLSFFFIGWIGFLQTHSQVYYRIAILFGVLLVISAFWSRFSLSWVQITIRNRSNKARVGEVFDQTVLVTNRSWLPILYLEIADLSGMAGGTGSRLITWVGPRQSRSYTSHIRLVKRGNFTVGHKLLRAGDPLRLFLREKTLQFAQNLLVYPSYQLLQPQLPIPSILRDGRRRHKRSVEPSVQFSEIRQYVPGDDLKRVHWLSSRRLGKLVVKEFDQFLAHEVWIVLDADKSAQWSLQGTGIEPDPWIFAKKETNKIPTESFELAVHIAATLCHLLTVTNVPFGFITNAAGIKRLAVDAGHRHESKVMELLAMAQPTVSRRFGHLVQESIPSIAPGSLVYCITAVGLVDAKLVLRPYLEKKISPQLFHIDSNASVNLVNGTIPICSLSPLEDIRLKMELFLQKVEGGKENG